MTELSGEGGEARNGCCGRTVRRDLVRTPWAEGKHAVKVAVVGAGVAGLTTALALTEIGIEVEVFEQAKAFASVGAGFMLSPNATRVLSRLGAADGLAATAVVPSGMLMRRWSDGSTIIYQPLGTQSAARWGAPHFGTLRADVVSALIAQLPADRAPQLGHRLVALDQDDDGVTLRFADRPSVRADAVVGADGLHSVVAQLIDAATEPEQSAYTCFRALVPAADLDGLGVSDAWQVWLGPDRHLVHYFVAGGALLNVVAFVPLANSPESWSAQGDPQVLRSAFAGWHPTITGLLERIATPSAWGLYERPVRDRWSQGRVMVLGDAAHPMLPFFAQGASQAVEDAALLALLLRDAPAATLPSLFRKHTQLRLDRVRQVQQIAHRNATEYHLADGPQQVERDRRFADAAAGDPDVNTGWLLGYDVHTALDDTALDDTALDDTALDDTALDDTALDDTALDDTATDDTASETALDAGVLEGNPS